MSIFDPMWVRAYRARFGGLPPSYTVFDSKTSGVDTGQDVILQAAMIRVVDGNIAEKTAFYIDWSKVEQVPRSWLEERIQYTQAKMAERGQSVPMVDLDKAFSEGLHPVEAMTRIRQVQTEDLQAGRYWVTHGGTRFDYPILKRHMRFVWPEGVLPIDALLRYDSGAFEKGRQMNDVPLDRDSLDEWQTRIINKVAKIKWALDPHCTAVYGLHQKVAGVTSPSGDAMDDAQLGQALWEAIRGEINANG